MTLKDGSRLVGELAGPAELKIKTEYGEVSIPRRLIVSVNWSGGPEKAFVQMRSGDRLTGKLEGTTLQLKAVWGEVSIETQHVVCVNWGAAAVTGTYPHPSWGRPGPNPYGPYGASPSGLYSGSYGSPSAVGTSAARKAPSASYTAPRSTPSPVEPKRTSFHITVPVPR